MKRLTIASIMISVLLAISLGVIHQVQKGIGADGKNHYDSSAPNNAKQKEGNTASIPSSLEVYVEPKLRGLSAENVKLYVTSWCGYCKKAKAYMAANGIRYQELDIERDPIAKSDFQRHRGRTVPLLVMGDKTLRGFRSSSYDKFFVN
jgi:glutaredoxin